MTTLVINVVDVIITLAMIAIGAMTMIEPMTALVMIVITSMTTPAMVVIELLKAHTTNAVE